MQPIQIEALTAESFSHFGTIIAFPKNSENGRFEVLLQEEVEPWRIAVLRVTMRIAPRVECHPTSMESFEPISGFGVLLVAQSHCPDCIKAFALDRPICLAKGVWHELITLSAECHCKITENKAVTTQFHPLPHPVGAYLQQTYF